MAGGEAGRHRVPIEVEAPCRCRWCTRRACREERGTSPSAMAVPGHNVRTLSLNISSRRPAAPEVRLRDRNATGYSAGQGTAEFTQKFASAPLDIIFTHHIMKVR